MPRSFETFRKVGSYEIDNLTQEEPSCFNNMVRVVKYRITVEKVEEPIETIRARIQKLWDERANFHHYQPLIDIGKKYGMRLSQ